MKKSNHYVDNHLFLEEITTYRNLVIESKANGVERPRVPEYIGECLLKISTHLARKPNFSNYPFREDMVSDGIENCLLYIDNFDPSKSTNPFAYFTQIIYFAFLRKIQKEKKHMYVKFKSMENEIVNALVENNGDNTITSQLNGALHEAHADNFIRDFIESFELNKRRKVVSKKKKLGLEQFMEEEHADTITRPD
jgi:DNA-directed RNA polymerase specialized sigma subunit